MKKTNNIFPQKLICAAIAATTFSMMMPAFAIVFQDNNSLLHWQDTSNMINFGGNATYTGGNTTNATLGGSSTTGGTGNDGGTTGDNDDETGNDGGTGNDDGTGGTIGDGSTIPTITGGDATELQEPSGNEPRYNIPATNGINYSIKVN